MVCTLHIAGSLSCVAVHMYLLFICTISKQTTSLIRAAAGNLEEGYTVTPAFMQDMLQRFKDQKLIHRRYAFAIIIQVGL